MSTYNEQRQEEAKERLACNYSIAALTASFVNKALNGKKLPSLGEMYPDIFAEDDARATALKFAADFKQFALKHNKGDK